jgi:hypothetical protein
MAALGMLLLAGCAAGTAQEVDLPAKNQSQWTLPLDEYQQPLIDTTLAAQQVLVQKCMADSGYAWGVYLDSPGVRPGPSWNEVRRKLFDVDLAQRFGYGNSREVARTDAEEERWRQVDAANRTVGGTATSVVDKCFAATGETLGTVGRTDPYGLAADLASSAYDDATKAESVLSAERKWRACMIPVGVPDLPDSPIMMPSDSVSALRPSEDAPSQIGTEAVVPTREREVAVGDAKCRASSGYSAASYEAEWDNQVEALQERADDLSRYHKQAEQLETRAKQILTENPVIE